MAGEAGMAVLYAVSEEFVDAGGTNVERSVIAAPDSDPDDGTTVVTTT